MVTDRRIVVQPPNQKMVAEGLAYPATVTHPGRDDDVQTYEVLIEKVYWRDDGDELVFRGRATIDDWKAFKTFFVEQCEAVIDGITGQAVRDVRSWALGLKPQPIDHSAPVRIDRHPPHGRASVMLESLVSILKADLGMEVAASLKSDPYGTWVELIERNPDNPPWRAYLSRREIGEEDKIESEATMLTFWAGGHQPVVEEIDGGTSITRPLPIYRAVVLLTLDGVRALPCNAPLPPDLY